jgi:LmbE family N-acetylglucosaminyl deacetylase
MTDARRFTVVSFHAHPDDEALLTGGTLARAAAEGHRVVVVVATAGEAGLSDTDAATGGAGLGARRRRELEASCRALGVDRVQVLGYPDSGSAQIVGEAAEGRETPFALADPGDVAERLAAILVEEDAAVLTSYDGQGGYGHPDHVQVHRVAALAAARAGTPVLLEATVDRRRIAPAIRVLRALRKVLPVPELPHAATLYTAHREITHRVDVRPFLTQKRRALGAHVSQAGGGSGARTVALLLRVPGPASGWVLGREWFREVGRTPGHPPVDDIFASLRR